MPANSDSNIMKSDKISANSALIFLTDDEYFDVNLSNRQFANFHFTPNHSIKAKTSGCNQAK